MIDALCAGRPTRRIKVPPLIYSPFPLLEGKSRRHPETAVKIKPHTRANFMCA
jgi:hypothetical protein